MTERLADITTRIESIRKLGVVVNAMRGIAAARAQQARTQLVAVDGYSATIGRAIGRVLPLAPEPSFQRDGQIPRKALVVFLAEQGFAGAFSERILDSIQNEPAANALFLIGTRGTSLARERDMLPGWQRALPSHSPAIPRFADRIAEAVYQGIANGTFSTLDVVFSMARPGAPITIERRRLLPFDTAAIPREATRGEPLLNLSPPILLARLTANYLHAQLCHAALHAFAAENEARMQAMAATRGQVERTLACLQMTQRIVRQEEITAEIIELAAGETANRST